MDDAGRSPVLDWLQSLRLRERVAFRKVRLRIERLGELGHELRRPEADSVGRGLYELRARSGRVNYRLLYFFHGRDSVVLVHGMTKEDGLPLQEIRRALDRKTRFENNPERHTRTEDLVNGEDS